VGEFTNVMNRLAVVHEPKPYAEPLAFVASRRRNAAQLFRAAKRHSRLVRILRIAVPIAGITALAIVAFAAWLDPMRLLSDLPIGLRDVIISGTKIKMELPRLSGFTRDARPYDLNARSAAQDVTKPNLIELTELHAKFQMTDKSTVELSAANGLFDTKAEQLTLDNNILVTSSSGYEGHLSEAVVNTRTGTIVSDKPVSVKMLETTIKANGLEIEQAGDLIRFKGGVAMQLMPNKDRPPAAEQDAK
jgi:lipopolysaccharide export system protein LptC